MSAPSTKDDGAAVATQKPRDEVKKEQVEKKFITNLVNNADTCLSLLLQRAELWDSPLYSDVRVKICEIARKPLQYPPPPIGWGVDRNCLTKGISNQLTNRTMDRPNMNVVYLQITHADCVKRTESIGINELSRDIGTQHRWKFTGVDGDNNTFLLRIDSALNVAAMTLTPGTIAQVTSSFPVYFNHDDSNDNRCAVVVRKFEIVGKQPVPDDLLSGGNNNKSAISSARLFSLSNLVIRLSHKPHDT
jgi:hypothetical protein